MPRKNVMEGNGSDVVIQEFIKLLQGKGGEYTAETVRTGDKIILPEGANIPDIIQSLERQHSMEEQWTNIHVTLSVPPWDGAIALKKAIKETLGMVIQNEGFGGSHQIEVEVELGKTISISWGSFELPGMEEAEVRTDTTRENGRIVFQCHARCKKRYEQRVRRMLDKTRDIAMKESLHRGKAFSITFTDEDGDPITMPEPKFFLLEPEDPIFRLDIEDSIDRNVFVPLRDHAILTELGETLKRGVLFAGDYGVGKTMLASHIARMATAHGWTFIYVKNANDLPEALRYSQHYLQPVVIFAEDIDRVAVKERTDEVNELLNELDGIDSKSGKIMTILTTNHPENINEAMFRPGRIDLMIEVLPPDAEAVSRMITRTANGTLAEGTDLSEISAVLTGETPARVRESVKRAKLAAIRRTQSANFTITDKDLHVVANEVIREKTAIKRSEDTSHVPQMKALAEGFAGAAQAITKSINGSGGEVYESAAN